MANGEDSYPVMIVKMVEGEPCVHDLMLAERLELKRPRDIRPLIERNTAEAERYGTLRYSIATPIGGGPVATEYWLNEAQAILICMRSNADRAPDIREEIIRVFLAWRNGTLAPRETGHLTVETVRGVVREEIEPLKMLVTRVDDKLTTVSRRIDDRIPRKDPSEKNLRIYCHVVAKCFGGLCPCGCKQKIVEDKGNILLDEKRQPLAVPDHWYSRERNGLEAMWLVHRDCNARLKDDDYRRSKHSRFDVFHQERKAVQADVYHPPRKPKKRRSKKSDSHASQFAFAFKLK
jgi:hypothetical protein